jgi:hypothetical protein
MNKRHKVLLAAAIASAMVFGGSTAAFAVVYGAKDCGWPTHAFVEATTKGKPTLKIAGTNGTSRSETFASSSTWQRNWVNSPTEDSTSASATGYSSIQSGGVGCSI